MVVIAGKSGSPSVKQTGDKGSNLKKNPHRGKSSNDSSKQSLAIKAKKKKYGNIASIIVKINSNRNNTFVTVTNTNGDVIFWANGGVVGFKGAKKSTPFAAILAADKVCKEAEELGAKTAILEVQGAGPGRESAIKTVGSFSFEITKIVEKTRNSHGGVRPKKRRRT